MSGTWIPLPASAASRSSFESGRSEEHTSELQSRSDLVCRLLLEKKKKHVPPADVDTGARSQGTAAEPTRRRDPRERRAAREEHSSERAAPVDLEVCEHLAHSYDVYLLCRV